MSFAKTYSAQPGILGARIIDVEVDISKGLNAFAIVGLGDKSVEEAKDRISSAIKNSGFKSPKQSNHKVVISLAPADSRKEGPIFDLAMAIAYLAATEEIFFEPDKKIFLGELSLDGQLRKISGVLTAVTAAKKIGFTEIYLPKENAKEAALVSGICIFGAENLNQIVDHLTTENKIRVQAKTIVETKFLPEGNDFSDIVGQESAKRGLEIAAAGGHNIMMYGPPGTGKTMLAKALGGILPPLPFEEILEITGIHSAAGTLKDDLVSLPPIRSPHHTASYVSLIGGGTVPKPGEVTLAHRGVLFLDEFPEFDKKALEALRQPLEDREVSISRARGSVTFPANFILIAAMNPCPCGNRGSRTKECICRPVDLLKYQRKISGPIADRIDMWIEVSNVSHADLSSSKANKQESGSPTIKNRVVIARDKQKKRFESVSKNIKTNCEMSAKDIRNLIYLSEKTKEVLDKSAAKMGLSARAYHRVIKLARTIADLDQKENIESEHVLEALQYRPKN